MIDSHCHLDFAAFDQDRKQVIARAWQKGVKKIVIPGVAADRWTNLIQLCVQEPRLEFALGLHPWFLPQFRSCDLNQLDQLLRQYKGIIKAVGETGLDFALDTNEPQVSQARQEEVFCAQLELARQHDLPVIVHHRKSHHRILHCLKACQFDRGGVIHAFSGSIEQARAYLKLGFKLGIGGTVTYSRARKTRDAVAALPADALLLETDAPDMPMQGRQGQRNSPEYLDDVLRATAAIRGESYACLEQQTDTNARQLFSLS